MPVQIYVEAITEYVPVRPYGAIEWRRRAEYRNDGTEEKEWGATEQSLWRSNHVGQTGAIDKHRSAGIKPRTVRICSAVIRTTGTNGRSAMLVGNGVTNKPAERPVA